jgi:heterodisulfide reductase subunit B2
MRVSYFPGCALHGTAREYDESTKAVAQLLGVELCELPDWNCCGASSAHATDETLAIAIAGRNLAIARRLDMDLVVPCAACYSRLKAAERDRDSDKPMAQEGHLRVESLLDFFFSSGLTETVARLNKRPLKGLKVVCYYGCLLVRPPKVTGEKHHENPESMDKLMELLGAQPVPWPYKTDCCGASLVLTRTDIVLTLTGNLLENARKAGAEAIVVACPLCQSNLDSRQEDIFRKTGKRYDLPVFYFTELIGIGLGHKDAPKWLKRHFVDPMRLLASKGLV